MWSMFTLVLSELLSSSHYGNIPTKWLRERSMLSHVGRKELGAVLLCVFTLQQGNPQGVARVVSSLNSLNIWRRFDSWIYEYSNICGGEELFLNWSSIFLRIDLMTFACGDTLFSERKKKRKKKEHFSWACGEPLTYEMKETSSGSQSQLEFFLYLILLRL